jgi:hypothetical protein
VKNSFSFFKWLFAKRGRWIPAIALFSLVVIIISTLVSLTFVYDIKWVLHKQYDVFLDTLNQQTEYEYQQQQAAKEKARIENLKIDTVKYQQLWESSNYTSYKIFFKTNQYKGVSSDYGSDRILVMQINDNKVTSIKKYSSNTAIDTNDSGYFAFVPNLFNAIQDALNQKVNQDVTNSLNQLCPGLFLTSSSQHISGLIYVDAEFNTESGYPERVEIRYQDEYNNITNIINYEILYLRVAGY